MFDANDPGFLAPGDLPGRIAEWCADRGIAAPQGRAEFARSIIESLAEAFAGAVRDASILSGVDVETIHVVGGGARNELLCSWTASASGLPVLAGPDEATVLGNLLVQAMAAGEISSLADGREVVRASVEPTFHEPDEAPEWDEARARFATLVAGRSLEVSA